MHYNTSGGTTLWLNFNIPLFLFKPTLLSIVTGKSNTTMISHAYLDVDSDQPMWEDRYEPNPTAMTFCRY